MPALSRNYEHQASSYTCASNVFSIYDNLGVTQYIPFTITEASNYFYQDVKSILTEAGMLEASDDSRNMVKVLGQEYTIVVINCLDRQYCGSATAQVTPTNGTTEAYATPIPVIFRNGQVWKNYDGYLVNNNSFASANVADNTTGGYGVGNGYCARGSNSAASGNTAPATYYHPHTTVYGGRVQRICIRRTGKTTVTGTNYSTGNLADFKNANYPLHILAHSIRYDANDYRYSLTCYYNTNYVYISFGLKTRDYQIPFCFMAKGMDKDGKNLHYFTADPSSATPLYAGAAGVSDGLSFNTGQQMYFSSYIPTPIISGWNTTPVQRINNMKQKAYTLHTLISLDESEMQEINEHKIFKAINEHQTSPALIFNTFDNFSSCNHVPRYTPHEPGETYKIPLKLRHGYGEFDNIFYTPDMTLAYNTFYEIDGETYYLVGHDYRTDYDHYYYNVLLKM